MSVDFGQFHIIPFPFLRNILTLGLWMSFMIQWSSSMCEFKPPEQKLIAMHLKYLMLHENIFHGIYMLKKSRNDWVFLEKIRACSVTDLSSWFLLSLSSRWALFWHLPVENTLKFIFLDTDIITTGNLLTMIFKFHGLPWIYLYFCMLL